MVVESLYFILNLISIESGNRIWELIFENLEILEHLGVLGCSLVLHRNVCDFLRINAFSFLQKIMIFGLNPFPLWVYIHLLCAFS